MLASISVSRTPGRKRDPGRRFAVVTRSDHLRRRKREVSLIGRVHVATDERPLWHNPKANDRIALLSLD
jgi:hypothetical protein